MPSVRHIPTCLIIIAALVVSGCGLKNDIITIDYTSPLNAQKINGAADVAVRVNIADQRKIKKNVGKKGSEYSVLGEIIAKNDITETLRNAIESELQSRGFRLEDGDVEVYVELIKFYNELKGFNEKAFAELIMSAQVKNANNEIVYVKSVTGEGVESTGMLREGSDAKVALEAALQDAVSKLVTDDNFISALFKAAQ
jgi:uncharacterized lipoprotein